MKKPIFVLLSAVFFLSISGLQISTDPAFLQELKEKLNEYRLSFPEEKIYVKTDKPFYKPGEEIWFNAFVLDSESHFSTSISDVLYVEFVDPRGVVASRSELPIKEGTAHGQFTLSKEAPGGGYQLKAYTQWTRNLGDRGVFSKKIPVQSVITPRLLLELDFEKEAYGPGDVVTASLTGTNLKNEQLSGAEVSFIASLDGKELISDHSTTDTEGKLEIRVTLPDDLNTTNGLLNVIVEKVGIQESISRSIPIVLNHISLEFFPESGHYLEEVESTIAFKGLNEYGKGADISGVIVNENDEVVTSFESYHMGMGAFRFTPEPGEQYYARINSPVQIQERFPLPKARTSGFSMSFSQEKESVLIDIYASASQKAQLIGLSHGEISSTKSLELKQGMNQLTISTEPYPTGITVFTLFDSVGRPQNERLVFLNHSGGLNIELETDKLEYQPSEQVKLKIRTTDSKGKPVQSKLALSVVDDQLISFADDHQDHLLSAMLLSSEVKGEIQEPDFYFDKNEPKARQALDYLLMTQGWRRFNWKEIIEDRAIRQITYLPERLSELSGMLYGKNGRSVSGEVTLIEMEGERRVETVKSTASGFFMFKNIDPTRNYLLLTGKKNKVSLDNRPDKSSGIKSKRESHSIQMVIADTIARGFTPPAAPTLDSRPTTVNISMQGDVASLGEVVVVAMGATEKSNITGSVTVVRTDDVFPGDMARLNGIAPGIAITSESGNTGVAPDIRIRGNSSITANSGEPLYVVDGFPVTPAIGQNFSAFDLIDPIDIESISLIKSPEATTLYGSRGANGVIIISTKQRIGYRGYYNYGQAPAKYIGRYIKPRKFTPAREFYVPPPSNSSGKVRRDFRTTVHWAHTVITDEKGKAELTFYNNDKVSAFRVNAEGFSKTGDLGRNETVYHTLLPLSLDTKLPEFLGFEDELRLPVLVKNETRNRINSTVNLAIPKELAVSEKTRQLISLEAGETRTVYYTIKPQGRSGSFKLSISASTAGFKDRIDHELKVRPVGFPQHLSFSAKTLDSTYTFMLNDVEQSTVTAEFVAYADILSDLLSGIESMLREPHGCFEQVSSTTFPNILVLQYLKESGLLELETEQKAMDLIAKGYKKLLSYEIRGGGFEWFGKPAAHTGLTAYGLLEFHEMQKVYPDVNQQMMQRTRNWLLSRRNGNGDFKLTHGGLDSFRGASQQVSNAYIVYALASTGTTDLNLEYQKALDEAKSSKDLYSMALIANAAAELKKEDDFQELVAYFRETLNQKGFDGVTADHSIVRSSGQALKTETLSLWTTALLKADDLPMSLIDACINEIIGSRKYGRFGSTQSTVTALSALTAYAKKMRVAKSAGNISLVLDEREIEKIHYERESKRVDSRGFADELLTDQQQSLRIAYQGTESPLPYSVDIQWYTRKPQSDENCQVDLLTTLNKSEVAVNETVQLTATLRNKTEKGLPMSMAVIGIPTGLSLQPWQLQELKDKELVDFYEIIDGNLIIYYRELQAGVSKSIKLDLKAELPGKYRGTASSAYLYYTDEYKTWKKGLEIEVTH